ncbi:hypothetical protein RQP46_002794 [Phenoliferia psychrophenolica]
MSFEASLASHLMLDPSSNYNSGDLHASHHRQSSSTTSSQFNTLSYDSALGFPEYLQPTPSNGNGPDSDLRISTRASSRMHKPSMGSSSSPQHAFALGRPPLATTATAPSYVPTAAFSHPALPEFGGQTETSPTMYHQSPTHGLPPPNAYGGAHKRTPSTRRARADSSPYPTQQSPFQGGYDSDFGGSDLSEYLNQQQQGHGQQYGHGSDMGDWSDSVSRRSSMSSSGWSSYDPSSGTSGSDLSASPTQYDDSSFLDNSVGSAATTPSLFSQGQLGHLGVVGGNGAITDSGGSSVEETRVALERFAGNVKNAVTSSAQDRARGAFVQAWLGLSYQVFPEGNVSRQGLYGSYLKSCTLHGVKAINSASFGKAVRQRYPDIKTRRLGVRGASRYHYTGIRPANASEAAILAQLAKEESENNQAHSSSSSSSRAGSAETPSPVEGSNESPVVESSEPEDDSRISHHLSAPSFFNEAQPKTPTTARPTTMSTSSSSLSTNSTAHRRHMSSNSKALSIAVPRGSAFVAGEKTAVAPPPPGTVTLSAHQPLAGFPPIEDALAVAGPGVDHALAFEFWQRYSTHCHTLLESVRAYSQFELGVRTWWNNLDQPQMALVQIPAVSQLVYRADAAVYHDILEFLHAQILVNMPPQAFASLRNLADNMERIQTISLGSFDGGAFPGPKIELAARFGHLVTRHLGLCQLAQALTGIVNNPANLREMKEAWDQIDFEAIKNQSALVSNCEHSLLEDCFEGFKDILQNPGQVPIETFIRWADQCFDRCIAPATSAAHRQTSPRSLLIRWSFVTSQVMRDLTLRSAPTFGSFAIASTFFDEFLSFQVLRRVALQISAIAPALEAPRQIFPGEPHPSTRQTGEYPAVVAAAAPSDALFPQAPSHGDAIMKDQLQALESFSPLQYPSDYSDTLEPQQHHQFVDASRSFVGADAHLGEYGAGQYDHSITTGYGQQHHSPQDHLALMDADVERFGDLRFDSSPGSASSPES